MPVAVYVLGLAIFAQGTSEMMLAGLLPELSGDLGVGIPQAGLLISAFAVGMLVGAPVLAVLTLRWRRRVTLVGFLVLFAALHAVGALTDSYDVLMVTRALSAFVYGGFWSVAAVTVLSIVPADRRGRAIGVVAGGLTIATVVGLPLGTLVGQNLGWRAAFWVVAALSLAAAAAAALTIHNGPGGAVRPSVGAELRAMANPRLWLAYATTALLMTALIVTFGYLAPLLTETTGLPDGAVPVVLGVYGIGSLIGITVGGRTADAYPFRTLAYGIGGLVAASVLLATAATRPVPAVAAVFLVGVFGFAVNPALTTRVFSESEQAPTLASALNVSAFNVGITAGPWLGGIALEAGAGYPVVAWLGAGAGVFALGAVVLGAVSVRRAAALVP
ncbi:Cmx/CmrA family chloramphenicol efflux MFS transporter [Actinophytocola sp. NPDC049390]|uniref:Cmx/CmrA family chloramphenicol efflux MFS transporter n=1 Tax=Actinophytocola sp. NPDC049390 TaxID=3363894 RepID=UPI0037AC8E8F